MLNGYFNNQYWPANYWPNYWPGGGVYNVSLALASLSTMAEAVNVGMNPDSIGFSAGSALGDGAIGTFPGAAVLPVVSGLNQDSQQAMLSAVALVVSAAFGLSNVQAMQVATVLAASVSLGLSPAIAIQVALNLAQISSILVSGSKSSSGTVSLSGATALSLQMSQGLLVTMALNVAALMDPRAQATLAASEVLSAQATLGVTPTIITQGGVSLAAVTELQLVGGNLWVVSLNLEGQTVLESGGGCDVLAQIFLGATSQIIFSRMIPGGFKILVVCSSPELFAKVSSPELFAKVSDN